MNTGEGAEMKTNIWNPSSLSGGISWWCLAVERGFLCVLNSAWEKVLKSHQLWAPAPSEATRTRNVPGRSGHWGFSQFAVEAGASLSPRHSPAADHSVKKEMKVSTSFCQQKHQKLSFNNIFAVSACSGYAKTKQACSGPSAPCPGVTLPVPLW